MDTKFDDDEQIPATLAFESGPAPEDFISGKIAARFINKLDAPLEKTDYRLIVELMGSDTGGQRSGVDIVTVLDVSGSMAGKKLEKLKTSMKFLVKKLSPIDRLSIVTFSRRAHKVSPLTGMNKNAQDDVEKLIDKLKAGGGTDIAAGLQTALQLLAGRRQKDGRTSAIMLMSDGELSSGCRDPSTVLTGDVPVYTFGLGKDHDSKVLEGIASRSNKGTYSIADVDGSDSASLNIAFSSCLGGLLSVVVEDLELIITPLDTEIKDVRVGNYERAYDNDGSVTISFGNLYNREKRMTTVFLTLPPVESRITSDIVKITYSFRPSVGAELYEAPPLYKGVTRTSSPVSVEPAELINEVARGDTADAMRGAREQADNDDLDGAKGTLKNAEEALDALNRETDELIKALKYEVQEFSRLLKDPETYRKEGRAFALSSELSHGLQRFAARGDTTQLLALAIPLAVVFANQSKAYDENGTPVPTPEEDKKIVEKLIETLPKPPTAAASPATSANPLVEHAGSLNRHLSEAIDSLKAIQKLISDLQSA